MLTKRHVYLAISPGCAQGPFQHFHWQLEGKRSSLSSAQLTQSQEMALISQLTGVDRLE